MRVNPNFRKQLDTAFNQATKVLAFEVAGQLIDNMATQTGTGTHYPELPNRSSQRSSSTMVGPGQIPDTPQEAEYSVVQSGHLVGRVDARLDADTWETGFFNVDMLQALRQEFGDFLVAPRANLYRTASSEETMQRVENELRKL